jgi:hypothetical protein
MRRDAVIVSVVEKLWMTRAKVVDKLRARIFFARDRSPLRRPVPVDGGFAHRFA